VAITKSIDYYSNGNIRYEKWHREDGEFYLHREDGPAYVVYYVSGEKMNEAWWVNGKKHRIDGPAFIHYNEDDTIWLESYYINGKRLSKEEWENHPLRQEYLIKEAMKEALK